MLAPDDTAEDAPFADIAETYVEFVGVYWQEMLGYGLAAVAFTLLWSTLVGRRRAAAPWVGERWLRLALVVALVGVGLWRAYSNATCFDDAYISLRYVENFLAGKGLVWNEGEYVEGYTNFLWVMIVSALRWLLPLETPLLAVLASMAAFGLNLFTVWRIGLHVAPPFHARAFAFPVAVALLAVQNTFTDYGTTGLETAFASLMVNLGVLALIREDGPKATFWAGLCWIMATLTRPDHALFYAIGSAVVFVTWVVPAWQARAGGLKAIYRAGLLPMLTYAAPFLIWLVYAAWKLRYYGELMPNTYYAKSAYTTYYSQGLVYAAVFHLGSHLWLPLLAVFLIWPWRGPSNTPGRRFLAFAVPAVLAYEWYVIRVGGDFMEGRFYVSLIPLMLLAGEQVVHELSLSKDQRERDRANARWFGPSPTPAPDAAPTPDPDAEPSQPPRQRAPLRLGAMAMIFVMAASAIGIRMIAPRKSRWKLTDETSYYPIVEWSPIVIDHANYRVAKVLERVEAGVRERGGPEPIIAAGAIGLLGYYSHMTLIDRLGLTDATVAHREIEKRGRPGHEKWADPAYIRERGTHFVRGGGYPKWFKTYGTIRWGPKTGGRRWYILKYDPELMEAISEADPDVWFYDFEIYIDRYIARLPYSNVKKVRREFDFFKTYYFDHTDDPERREAFSTYFQWVREGHKPRELVNDGRWDVYKQRGADASIRERELRAARAARKRELAGTPEPATNKPATKQPTAKPRPTRIPAKPSPGTEGDTDHDDDGGGDELTEAAEDDAADDDDGADDAAGEAAEDDAG